MMSRPARWDMATGRLNRQAAALSGKGIRACVRIAAGACPGDHQLGKGVAGRSRQREYAITNSICVFSLRLRPPPCRGLRASAFPHFACGGPLGHPQSGDRSSSTPPRELIGRQPFHQSLHASVETLKTAHQSLRIGSRRPSSARTGLRDLRNVSAPRVIPKMTQERLHAGQKEFARGASHEFG